MRCSFVVSPPGFPRETCPRDARRFFDATPFCDEHVVLAGLRAGDMNLHDPLLQYSNVHAVRGNRVRLRTATAPSPRSRPASAPPTPARPPRDRPAGGAGAPGGDRMKQQHHLVRAARQGLDVLAFTVTANEGLAEVADLEATELDAHRCGKRCEEHCAQHYVDAELEHPCCLGSGPPRTVRLLDASVTVKLDARGRIEAVNVHQATPALFDALPLPPRGGEGNWKSFRKPGLEVTFFRDWRELPEVGR